MARLSVILSVASCGLVTMAPFASELNAMGKGRGVPNPVASQGLDTFPETLERPLFAPSRHPVAPEKPAVVPAAQAPQPDAPPNVVLAGVVSTPRGMIAILSLPQNAKFVQAKVNDEVSGWKVVEISPQHVVAEKGGRHLELSMFQMIEPPLKPTGQLSPPNQAEQVSRGRNQSAAPRPQMPL